MKEQVITPRAGRSAASGKGRAGEITQRPTRRERGGASASRAKTKGWRKGLTYLPLIGKITLAVIVGVLLFTGYRAAASASFFQARNVDVSGTSRASSDEIKAIVLKGVAQTGVWNADLNAISRELKKIGWVREAVVSRILPDGLRVRVIERVPRAVVRMNAGNFVWVDEEAATLGAASPADQISMRGWDGQEIENAGEQNRERVQKFLLMARDLEAKGISRRISEVNFNDLRDVRAQLTGDDAQVEIRLGREDFGNRLAFALAELDERRNTAIYPFIQYINIAQGIEKGKDSMTIGVDPAALNLHTASNDSSGPEIESAKAATRNEARPPAESRKAKEKVARREDDERGRRKEQARKDQDKREKDKKDKTSREVRAEGRPRRVG